VKELAKMLAALVFFGLGVAMVALNIHALTITVLGFAGAFMLLAMLLAFRTDTVECFQAVLPLLPARWRGADPPHGC
jgi:hypothetical protein